MWIERIGFSLPAFTGFDTQLSGRDPLRRIDTYIVATRHAADPRLCISGFVGLRLTWLLDLGPSWVTLAAILGQIAAIYEFVR